MAWPLSADSPVTSTLFHEAYPDVPEVAAAAETQTLDATLAAFLLDPTTPLDHAAAVMSALGWDTRGRDHLRRFDAYLDTAAPAVAEELRMGSAPARVDFVRGYLRALDDYHDVGEAPDLLERAAAHLPGSFTVALLAAVVRSQVSFHDEVGTWCDIWLETDDVLQRFPEDQRDLRPAAVETVREYQELYSEHCVVGKSAGADPALATEEMAEDRRQTAS